MRGKVMSANGFLCEGKAPEAEMVNGLQVRVEMTRKRGSYK